jgi:lambda repressor-like predicted transcriptional regulator
MVRRKVLEEGVSRRQLARETGLSRKTIRKMLLHELP